MEPQKLLDLIGNTPLMESVNLIKNKSKKLLLKLEGTIREVKDRAARNMMVSALEEIKKGDKLIEATSGNTGCIGYDCTAVRYRNRINTSRRFHQTHANHACLWLRWS
jgi:cysteine synthase